MKKALFLLLISLCVISPSFCVSAKPNSDGYIVKMREERIGKSTYIHVKTQKEVEILRQHDDVEYIEPNYEVKLFDASPSQTGHGADLWNLQMIDLSSAWEYGCYGNGIRVAVIDSGLCDHPAISANTLPGFNYISQTSDVNDVLGHGTFVSGIITSVAYRSKIVPLKCFETGNTTYLNRIIEAIYDAADVYNCDVINMSFGLLDDSLAFKEAIDYATAKGLICVAAVGNDGTNTLYYPAAYDNVIGVGSVDENKNVSSFSQRNESVFVVAPGAMVLSLGLNNTYTTKNGTSHAAPHIAGLITLLKNVDRNARTEDIKDVLQSSSIDLGVEGWDAEYGFGLINANNAFDKVLENKPIFISPIDLDNENVSVVFFNNSEIERSAWSLFSIENEDEMIGLTSEAITAAPKSRQRITTNYCDGLINFFLFADFDTIMPLYNKAQLAI